MGCSIHSRRTNFPGYAMARNTTPDLRTVRGRLRAARNAAGLTHKQMAWRLGLSVHSSQSKEMGRVAIASNELAIWAKYTRCSVDWLVLGEGKPPPGLDRVDHVKQDGSMHRRHRPTELERVMAL